MIDATLNEIEARAAAATGGPWWNLATRTAHLVASMDGKPIAKLYDGDSGELISHARTDVPLLVAEVRRLRAFLARRMTEDYASDEYAREVLADQIDALLNPQGDPK